MKSGVKSLFAGDFSGWLDSMACCIIELKDYLEDLPNIGRVRYYRNKNGEIVWEKVTDCTFELAVFSC